ncbi:carbohydrate ABC transporter permease [Candidatus Mycoplasma mahonii]|uniref:carbohydrate ABC transporter permease n=1 Tax=Candidatus Mycoplasma mahonii TaxID=3004105 RepID=UPI0026F1BAAA|nr:sugar ABC transporter permease [Candidatus Mycoplasma mahonii]WKX02587.1 sugar ABC transporter permease [Candidatus Mycoplasma mahonii]
MTKVEIRKLLKERYYVASGKSNRQIKKIRRRNNVTGSIFVFTPILILFIYVFAAFGIAIWLSFYAGRLDPSLSKIRYVGWANWGLLFNQQKSIFLIAIKNTFIYASITTGFNIIGALIISSILNSKTVKKKNIFMTFYFLPQVTSGIAVAIIFIKLTGTNSFFGFNIIKNPSDAIWIMIISSVWTGISGGLVTFNTAFSGIDSTQYESASLDGAGTFKKFLRITVPSLGPILAYTVVTSIIGGMGVFDQAYVMSVAGGDSSSVMTWTLLGFARIIGLPNSGSGFAPNVGLGVATLVLLGITIFVLTRIANIIRPLERK